MGQRAGELEPRAPSRVHAEDEDQALAESTAAARQEIELTRADMTSTIDAIQDKLDPEVLSEQAKDTAHDVTDYAIREAKEAAREITDHAVVQARQAVQEISGQAKLALREATIGKVETMARTATDTAGGWRQSVVETIKANPMPAALVGLGVGWMLLNRPIGSQHSSLAYAQRGSDSAGYGAGMYSPTPYRPAAAHDSGVRGTVDGAQQSLGRAAERVQQTAGHAADEAQQTAGQVAAQVQGTAGQVVEQVQETGGQVVEQVQEQASRAQGFLQRQLEENPLVVGTVAVAIGAVLAGTVPSTPREDRMLGHTRDRMMSTATELAQDTIQKVERVVDEAQSAAKEEAREQSLVGEGGAS
jgi:Protein of unknown function (DUF3618)